MGFFILLSTAILYLNLSYLGFLHIQLEIRCEMYMKNCYLQISEHFAEVFFTSYFTEEQTIPIYLFAKMQTFLANHTGMMYSCTSEYCYPTNNETGNNSNHFTCRSRGKKDSNLRCKINRRRAEALESLQTEAIKHVRDYKL